jgi:hypothetical protein
VLGESANLSQTTPAMITPSQNAVAVVRVVEEDRAQKGGADRADARPHRIAGADIDALERDAEEAGVVQPAQVPVGKRSTSS